MNTSTPAPRRRNVIVIFTDDQRFDAAGYTGNPNIKTPNLAGASECAGVTEQFKTDLECHRASLLASPGMS